MVAVFKLSLQSAVVVLQHLAAVFTLTSKEMQTRRKLRILKQVLTAYFSPQFGEYPEGVLRIGLRDCHEWAYVNRSAGQRNVLKIIIRDHRTGMVR